MPDLPTTTQEQKEMLATIGVQSIDDLFSSIPPQIREQAKQRFGETLAERGLTEHELRRHFKGLAEKNASTYTHFLGGGIYDNIIPALVDQLIVRGEFLTCYTPYQPEISQGTLQAIFEFQTLIKRLTHTEVANASLYDGATAAAEAILMAQRISRKKEGTVLIAENVPPDYREVAQTFLQCHSTPPIDLKFNASGMVDTEHLGELLKTHDPYALLLSSPNYFGLIENIDQVKAILPDQCLLIVAVPDASALSIFEAPGKLGADVVVGEAHQLGTPMLFGGPHVGFFGTRKKFLRQIPGRLVGETVDKSGKRAYALTLATREQHIRREKATSNICTNQGLIALRTTMYLSFLGKQGFQNLGHLNYSLFQYLYRELESVGIRPKFKEGLHYREGVFEVPDLKNRFSNALAKQIVPGIPLAERLSALGNDFANCLLICVHPKHAKKDIDALVEVLSDG